MDINYTQVRNILCYIDASQDEGVKEAIFCELGRQCFLTRHIDQWVRGFGGDVSAFLDRVNVDGKSPYWQSLTFNKDRTVLYLTGREIARCPCPLADCGDPPVSLCTYCCRAFQEQVFGALFGCPVRVEITESRLLGGDCCSTAIHIGE